MLLIEKFEKGINEYRCDNIFKNLFLCFTKKYFECKCNEKHNFIKEEMHYAIELEIKDKKIFMNH